jgi:hypothetical protein
LRRRIGWLASGIGLTAAAVAVVIAVVTAGTPGAAGRSGPGKTQAGATSRLSGRQILLDAATTAAAARAGTGTYWTVKQGGRAPKPWTVQGWYTHAGVEYDAAPDGKEAYRQGDCAFSVGGRWLSYRQIQQLPVDPGALKAWIHWSMTAGWQPLEPCARHADPAPPVPVRSSPANVAPFYVTSVLRGLLFQVPAPPALRAAAFRALASMPDVRKAGYADGGVVLVIHDPPIPASKFPSGKEPKGTGVVKLIIDPATATLRAWTDYTGTTQILAAGWTNHMPKIVPLSQVYPAKP